MLDRPLSVLSEEQVREWVLHLVRDAVPEGVTLDYKSTVDFDSGPSARREFMKDLSAFANEIGGEIVVGIPTRPDPRGGPEIPDGSTPGIEPIPGLIEMLQDTAADFIHPRLLKVDHQVVSFDEGSVVYVFQVAQSAVGPHMVDGRFYHRSGHRCQPMEEHLVRERYHENLTRSQERGAFLDSQDIRIAEGSPAAQKKNLRVALIPELPIRGVTPVDAGILQQLQIVTGSPFLPTITWFGAHVREDDWPYWRFYDSGELILWDECPVWERRNWTGSTAEARFIAPFVAMFQKLAEVMWVARRFYEITSAPRGSLYLELRWVANVRNLIPDFFEDAFIPHLIPTVTLREGTFVQVEQECSFEDMFDPREVMADALRSLGRYFGQGDLDKRLLSTGDGRSLEVAVVMRDQGKVPVWPPRRN